MHLGEANIHREAVSVDGLAQSDPDIELDLSGSVDQDVLVRESRVDREVALCGNLESELDDCPVFYDDGTGGTGPA